MHEHVFCHTEALRLSAELSILEVSIAARALAVLDIAVLSMQAIGSTDKLEQAAGALMQKGTSRLLKRHERCFSRRS
jgi:hypothetical protein